MIGRVSAAIGAILFGLVAVSFAQPAAQASPDDVLWNAIRGQKGAGVYELFLKIYPKSRHADEARRQLEEATAVAGRTWRGFEALGQAPLPAKIDKRTIRKSVLRIETFGLLGKKPQFVKTRTAGRNPLKGKRMGTLGYLRAMQLASCVQQKIETCPILENVAGTAFAVDDRSTMVTARHVMSAWALEAVKANPGLKFEDVVQPFLLYDGQQALIYNSVQAKQRPKLKFWNAHPVPPAFVDFDNSMSNQLYTQSDYLEFGFDKPVFAANLKRSGLQIETAQSSLYAIGFPDLEGFRAVNDKEELKTEKLRNNSLTVSGGRFQGRYHAVFSTNAYSFNGMSGGPVLDASGDVLGVYTSVLDARYAKRGMFELSFYISTDKKLLRETWDLPLWRDLLARQEVERRDLDSAH